MKERRNDIIEKQEITLKLYSPLTGDFYKNDVDEYGWNNGVADYPTLFSGIDMCSLSTSDIVVTTKNGNETAYYVDSIQKAVKQRSSDDGGNLMLYFDEERNPNVKAKTLSAIPSVEIRGDELKGCTTVRLKEPLTGPEMRDLQDYLKGQFSDGWGEGFEQQEIQTSDGVLYVHFAEKRFDFEVEQVQSTEVSKEQPVPKRPKMKLVGEDGNIFAILGRASRLLKRNGQAEQAKEMSNRVYHSGDYYKALNIISEYVETELSEKTPAEPKEERGNVR